MDTNNEEERQTRTKTRKEKKQNVNATASTLADACKRHGVSDQPAASIATAVLQHAQMMSLDNKSKVIGGSKLKRERHEMRKKISRFLCRSLKKVKN